MRHGVPSLCRALHLDHGDEPRKLYTVEVT
jgi:hypothetical protein